MRHRYACIIRRWIWAITWQPGYNILNPNTPAPLVWPKVTTKYYVTLNDRGCVNTDSIRVRVVDFVTLAAKPIPPSVSLME